MWKCLCVNFKTFFADMLRSLMALLVLSFVGSAAAMEDYLFWNSVKLVYCDRIRAQSVYRNEDLSENCVIKVDFFENKVNGKIFRISLKSLVDIEPNKKNQWKKLQY